MKKNHQITFISILALGFLLLFSCEERSYYTNGNATLWFTSDTVSFDTVFTSIGSTTTNFRVHNPYGEDLEINSIRLEGGAASNFRINIDGAPELSITDKLLRANDSMYIFVDVNVDPTDKTLPFLLEDHIVFNTNGKEQKVLLQAYGQDAYHIKLGEWGDIAMQVVDKDTSYFVLLNNDTTLKADKPYYLHNSMAINENVELTLDPGVRFFIEKNKSIYVLGSLKSYGTVDAPVEFRGHRLDYYLDIPYDKVPGQWGVIALQSSSYDNEFTHTHIRNGLTGLYVDSLSVNDNPKVKLANCRIENMSSSAIYGINAEITAENCLFANSAQFLLYAYAGGVYDFTNCTFGNYYTRAVRNNASVRLMNYYVDSNVFYPADLQKANFTNCIVDGLNSIEVVISDSLDENVSEAAFNYSFDHCLLKVDISKIDTNDVHFSNTLWNKDPLFWDAKYEWNFHPDTLSPVIDMGVVTHLNEDINNIPYTDAPDIGAFEYMGAKDE